MNVFVFRDVYVFHKISFLSLVWLSEKIASDLVSHEKETQHHHYDICSVGMVQKSFWFQPIRHGNKNPNQGKNLANFDTNIKEDKVLQKSVGGKLVVQNFSCKAKAMEQAEYKGCSFSIGLEPEPTLESSYIIKCFVHDGKTYNCIDDIYVDAYVQQDTGQKRDYMANRKQCHINHHGL